mmetsp:Transcript_553/g.1367  ORF Transcript_553/g.1367 Transcript_553/m.1367 type:complete len:737 (-) Transcript_553:90-2300(-)
MPRKKRRRLSSCDLQRTSSHLLPLRSGFQRGYGGEYGLESSGDQTTAAKPGKKVWQPKNSFDDKMASQLDKTNKSLGEPNDTSSAPAHPLASSTQHVQTTSSPNEPAKAESPPPPAKAASPPPPSSRPTPPLPSKEQTKAAAPPEPSTPPPAVAPKPPAKTPPPKPPGPPPSQAPASPGKPISQDEKTVEEGNRFSADLRAKGLEAISTADSNLTRRDGEAFGAYHSYGQEKVEAFTEYINYTLQSDADLSGVLPIDPVSGDLFKVIADGVLLCKLLNKTQPGIVFEKAINLKIKSVHHKVENQNLAINSARAIGCNVINIGAQDLIDGRPHLVLGLLWQIIKILLLKRVSLKEHPELVLLLKPGEDLATLLKLPKEELLVRWVNFHLVNAGCEKRLSNFSSDVKDSTIYIYLMSRICPEHCDLSPLQEKDERRRAQKVLDNAAKIGCKTTFVKANDIVAGNKDLNFAFTALLFNEHPALYVDDTSNQVEVATLLEDDNAECTREERVFQNWMNSLGIDAQVHRLLEDCKTAEPLLQVMEKLNPTVVNWKMVNKNPRVQIKTIENCNYMVECAKALGLHTVNIGGKDIHDGNAKLVLGLVWQLMRHDTMSLLERLGGSSKLSDSDLVQWANDRVQAHFNSSSRKVSSLSDPSIATSLFLLQLCESVTPGLVDWDIVTEGSTDEDREHNAKYVLSVARKMGCGIFLLWEDVVEVKPKMLMTFLGSVMAVQRQKAAPS